MRFIVNNNDIADADATGPISGGAGLRMKRNHRMKKLFVTLFAASLTLSLLAADETDPFKSKKEKISYMLGMTYGKQLKQNDVDLEYESFLKGLKDSTSGGKTMLTEEQARTIYMEFSQELRAKTMEKQKVEGEKNKKLGETFLAENKKKDGVKTAASGLQYKIETAGTGKIPAPSDTVSCHYRGTLIDGTEFDSSYKRNQPATFPVKGVIPGWTEALQLMPEGSKWMLYLPSTIAYGERGRPNIPANSTLLFDIELIAIKAPGELAPPTGAVPPATGALVPPQGKTITIPSKGK